MQYLNKYFNHLKDRRSVVYLLSYALPVNKITSPGNASNIHRNLPREIKNIKRGLLKTVPRPQRKLKQLVSLANRVDKCRRHSRGFPFNIYTTPVIIDGPMNGFRHQIALGQIFRVCTLWFKTL